MTAAAESSLGYILREEAARFSPRQKRAAGDNYMGRRNGPEQDAERAERRCNVKSVARNTTMPIIPYSSLARLSPRGAFGCVGGLDEDLGYTQISAAINGGPHRDGVSGQHRCRREGKRSRATLRGRTARFANRPAASAI
jgi:hypothetical protein